MSSKLKEACGFEYTDSLVIFLYTRCETMLTDLIDMSLSKDLTDSFKEHME
jgi:hypothetical protein